MSNKEVFDFLESAAKKYGIEVSRCLIFFYLWDIVDHSEIFLLIFSVLATRIRYHPPDCTGELRRVRRSSLPFLPRFHPPSSSFPRSVTQPRSSHARNRLAHP